MSTAYICRTCNKTGQEHFYKTQKYYCKECFNKKCIEDGQNKVKDLKLRYGGKCTQCGYEKCLDALQFHHTDPTQKEFSLGQKRGLNLTDLIKELDKCILVCSNCHIEIHHSLRQNNQKG